jgi:hypothetical protein
MYQMDIKNRRMFLTVHDFYTIIAYDNGISRGI